MNENAQKWVAALRSGNYAQGIGALKANGKYCCLGVACDVYMKETGIGEWEKGEWEKWGGSLTGLESFIGKERSSTGILIDEVRAWLGLRNSFGDFRDGSLTTINDKDSDSNFNTIADLIESEPEGLFL